MQKLRVLSWAAFLMVKVAAADVSVEGDASRGAYFQVSTPESDRSLWSGPETRYDAVSQGGSNTAWKGFVRNHQVGLVLRHMHTTACLHYSDWRLCSPCGSRTFVRCC